MDRDGLVEIHNATALNTIVRTNRSGRYELTANISLDDLGGAWQPIGNASDPFTGIFDGKGFAIRDLRINASGLSAHGGLFGLARDATIRQLNLRVVALSSFANPSPVYAGGLAGQVENANIVDAYVEVAGDISARVVLRDNSATANRAAAYAYAGGLVGLARNSNITNSYARVAGSILADSNVSSALAGGLAGAAENLHLNNSYARVTGDIAAIGANSSFVGGLIGRDDGGTLMNSYVAARGNLSAAAANTSYVGGLLGFYLSAPEIDFVYTNFSDWRADLLTVINEQGNRTLEQLECPTALSANCSGATTYAGWDNATIWNFGDNKTLPTIISIRDRDSDFDGRKDLNDNCPSVANADQANLDNDTLGDACDDTDGDGVVDATDNCPRVANADQANLDNATGDQLGDACDDDIDGDDVLNAMDNCPREANADQANLDNTTGDRLGDVCDDDIDGDDVPNTMDNCPRQSGSMANNGCPEDGGTPTPPIDPGVDPMPVVHRINITTQQMLNNLTTNPAGDFRLAANLTVTEPWISVDFSGTLDGANHTIANLSASLFDTINRSASVANLGILGSILANQNDGNISWVYATGNISDNGPNGGLVGQNNGFISYSYATSNINGSGHNGGLVGHNTGMITNSYALGNVNGSGNSGGLVGFNNGGTINRSYATGHSDSYGGISFGSGGLVGRSETGLIINSYATGSVGVHLFSQRGGLVGITAEMNSITNSYATANFALRQFSGGLIGGSLREGPFTYSYHTQIVGGSVGGEARSLAQLRCPTAQTLGQACEGATTYEGWDDMLWDFGDNETLPTIADLPPCPTFLPNCRH